VPAIVPGGLLLKGVGLNILLGLGNQARVQLGAIPPPVFPGLTTTMPHRRLLLSAFHILHCDTRRDPFLTSEHLMSNADRLSVESQKDFGGFLGIDRSRMVTAKNPSHFFANTGRISSRIEQPVSSLKSTC